MYKKIIIFGVVVFSLLVGKVVMAVGASAENCSRTDNPFSEACNYGLDKTAGDLGYTSGPASGDIVSIVGVIVKAALATLAIIFFALTMYAGIRWLTARDNAELAERAKTTLENAIIGLVIVSASYAIATFVFGFITKTGGGDTNTISENCCLVKTSLTERPGEVVAAYPNISQAECQQKCSTSYTGVDYSCEYKEDFSGCSVGNFTQQQAQQQAQEDVLCCFKEEVSPSGRVIEAFTVNNETECRSSCVGIAGYNCLTRRVESSECDVVSP